MRNLLPATELGQKIVALREHRGLKQRQLAAKLGKSQTELSRWENGKVVPQYDTLVNIAAELGVGVGEFLEGGASKVRAEADAQRMRAEALRGEVPMLNQLDWLPGLLAKVLEMPDLTAGDRRALMAEVNAAGMRYWAVAAEWASGERGGAMRQAEISSGERARAAKQESVRGGVTVEPGGATDAPPELPLEEVARIVARQYSREVVAEAAKIQADSETDQHSI